MDLKTIIQKTAYKQDFVLKERTLHAVLVILCMEIQGEIHLVFQRRSALVTRPREIAFPGGKVEPTDVNLRQTGARETHEEMGIEYADLQVYHKLFRLSTKDLMNLDVFLGFTTLKSLDEMKPNLDEVESIFSIPLSILRKTPPTLHFIKSQYIVREKFNGETVTYFPPVDDMTSVNQGQDIWEDSQHPIFVYKTDYGYIWGLTAQILYQFIQMLDSDDVLTSI